MKRRDLLKTLLGTAAAIPLSIGFFPARAYSAAAEMTVWKSASCGCCGHWVEHMRNAGFSLKVVDVYDVSPIKTEQGVPNDLQSCHTAVIDGYVIEGHVPAPAVTRLLAERPQAKGLAVPGMPQSAPGMDHGNAPYEVVLFGLTGGETKIYERY